MTKVSKQKKRNPQILEDFIRMKSVFRTNEGTFPSVTSLSSSDSMHKVDTSEA